MDAALLFGGVVSNEICGEDWRLCVGYLAAGVAIVAGIGYICEKQSSDNETPLYIVF